MTSRRDYLIADSTEVAEPFQVRISRAGRSCHHAVAYTYDGNSQVTVTTDQNSNDWTKTYDAMGRHRTTVTPTVSSTSECPRLRIGAPQWCDGNGNAAKDQAHEWACHRFSCDTEYANVPEPFQARNFTGGTLVLPSQPADADSGTRARAEAARMDPA